MSGPNLVLHIIPWLALLVPAKGGQCDQGFIIEHAETCGHYSA
jgi:hypothetical protein